MQASSGTEDEDAAAARRVGEAYNISIYMMVGVPYLMLGGLTLLIRRGLKKNQDYLRANGRFEPPEDDPPLA